MSHSVLTQLLAQADQVDHFSLKVAKDDVWVPQHSRIDDPCVVFMRVWNKTDRLEEVLDVVTLIQIQL